MKLLMFALLAGLLLIGSLMAFGGSTGSTGSGNTTRKETTHYNTTRTDTRNTSGSRPEPARSYPNGTRTYPGTGSRTTDDARNSNNYTGERKTTSYERNYNYTRSSPRNYSGMPLRTETHGNYTNTTFSARGRTYNYTNWTGRMDNDTAERIILNTSEYARLNNSAREHIKQVAAAKNLTPKTVETLAYWSAHERELACANQTSTQDRVACRLNLPETNDTKGLYYLPEECRNLTDEHRAGCFEKYDKIQACRFKQGDDARYACVKEQLNYTRSAKEEVEACKNSVRGNDTRTDRSGANATSNPGIGSCISTVRAKVLDSAKFKLYNLEEKAERLMEYGVSNQTVTYFIAKLEELKLRMNAANSTEEQKAIYLQADALWKAFYERAKTEAKVDHEVGKQTGNATTRGSDETGRSNGSTSNSPNAALSIDEMVTRARYLAKYGVSESEISEFVERVTAINATMSAAADEATWQAANNDAQDTWQAFFQKAKAEALANYKSGNYPKNSS